MKRAHQGAVTAVAFKRPRGVSGPSSSPPVKPGTNVSPPPTSSPSKLADLKTYKIPRLAAPVVEPPPKADDPSPPPPPPPPPAPYPSEQYYQEHALQAAYNYQQQTAAPQQQYYTAPVQQPAPVAAPVAPPPLPEGRKRGVCTHWDSAKAYGFLQDHDMGKDGKRIFCHNTSLAWSAHEKVPPFASLAEGDEVEFEYSQGARGIEAIKVTAVAQHSTRRTGTVVQFNDEKGYGFIMDNQPDSIEGKQVMVHHKKIKGGAGFKSLTVGQIVEYGLIKGPKGYAAVDVLVVSPGGPILGRGPSDHYSQVPAPSSAPPPPPQQYSYPTPSAPAPPAPASNGPHTPRAQGAYQNGSQQAFAPQPNYVDPTPNYGPGQAYQPQTPAPTPPANTQYYQLPPPPLTSSYLPPALAPVRPRSPEYRRGPPPPANYGPPPPLRPQSPQRYTRSESSYASRGPPPPPPQQVQSYPLREQPAPYQPAPYQAPPPLPSHAYHDRPPPLQPPYPAPQYSNAGPPPPASAPYASPEPYARAPVHGWNPALALAAPSQTWTTAPYQHVAHLPPHQPQHHDPYRGGPPPPLPAPYPPPNGWANGSQMHSPPPPPYTGGNWGTAGPAQPNVGPPMRGGGGPQAWNAGGQGPPGPVPGRGPPGPGWNGPPVIRGGVGEGPFANR